MAAEIVEKKEILTNCLNLIGISVERHNGRLAQNDTLSLYIYKYIRCT